MPGRDLPAQHGRNHVPQLSGRDELSGGVHERDGVLLPDVRANAGAHADPHVPPHAGAVPSTDAAAECTPDARADPDAHAAADPGAHVHSVAQAIASANI